MNAHSKIEKDPPVVLFVYNRPNQTAAVLENLKINKIPLLYIFADAPRPGDESKVKEVHKLIDSIPWTKVHIIKRKKNMGLSASIKSGLNEVFKKHTSVIVIEDDIQVAPEFYDYMCSSLRVYEKNKLVAGVTGLRYPFKLPPTNSYAFDTFIYPRFSSWGWGTWKKEWQNLNWSRAELIPKLKVLLGATDMIDADMLNTFEYYTNEKLSGAWDVDFAANIVLQNKVFVWPTWNMVNNLGLLEGTHSSGIAPPWKLKYEKRRLSGNYKFITNPAVQPAIKMGFLNFFKTTIAAGQASVIEKNSLSLKSLSSRVVRKANRILKNRFNTKTALVSYLVDPLQHQKKGVKFVKYSNEGIAVAVVKVIRLLGFKTDVINWNDTKFVPQKKYDFIFLHGGANLKNIKAGIGPKTKIIYFATGCYWKFHNEQEENRLKDFERRHGVKLPPDRYINSSEEEANLIADAIVCLGNGFTKSTYSKFKKVYNLNIGTYKDDHYDNQQKDFEGGRNNFLFFSGDGNIHKGLDLLLDVFSKQSKFHLYVCTNLDKEFEEYYKDLLFKSKNIHYRGYVITKSSEYYELIDKCNYVILPSCSEANAGSVVDCIQQGLIPIVSKETGIDTLDYGITIQETNIDSVKEVINKITASPVDELEKASRKARATALADYSPELFERNMSRYISKVLGSQ